MTLRVATAFADPHVEAVVVRRLQEEPGRVTLERRCRDVVELTAVSMTGLVDAVVVDPRLRGLDRDVVAQISQRGVLTVGYFADDLQEGEPDGIGLRRVVRGDVRLVVDAICERSQGDDRNAHHERPPESYPIAEQAARPAGLITAVWGPPGAPGRTTAAVELAATLARRGHHTLLVDADTVAPCIGQHLGLVDDTSGLAAAVRAAAHGGLTPSLLTSLAVADPSGVTVLVGLPSGDRWTELRAASIENVLTCARATFDHVVLDVGFGIEGDDLAWAESAAPERYGAARAILPSADVLVCVSRLAPISLVRFIKAAPAARDLATTATTLVVANRYEAVRDRQGTAIVAESLGLSVSARIPNDPKSISRAVRHGRTVREQNAGRGSLNAAYDQLADAVESFAPSYDVPGASVSRAHRRLLRSAHRRHRHRDAGVV